jgi:hypothetical protein
MSNRQQDNSVHVIRESEEGTEARTETEACTLKVVSESKDKETGKGDSKSSELELGSFFLAVQFYL